MNPKDLVIGSVTKNKTLPLVLFIVSFAVVGVTMLFRSFALGNSTISGVAFKDMNRNGIVDMGEELMANQQIYLFNAAGTNIAVQYTDINGAYTFSGLEDGNYGVDYAFPSFSVLKMDWTPTTTVSYRPQHDISLVGNATADFGWRPIVRSTDPDKPIADKVYPSGLRVQIYNDVVNPDVIYDTLNTGSLVGAEQKVIIIRLDWGPYTATGSSAQGSPSTGYCCAASISTIDWMSWLNLGDNSLFHEYGHAWSHYYYNNIQQDPSLTEYLRVRGLAGDPRVNSSYGWSRFELIAEDYRQLFGNPKGSAGGQANGEIPAAKDVPGLREYLSGAFLVPPSSGLSDPVLTATASYSTEGPSVQLNWTASTGSVSRYDVYRDDVKIGFVNTPTTTYYDGPNLQYNTKYSYYVKAVNANNAASKSNTIEVVTLARDTEKPSTPSGLLSTGVTNTSISLKWNAATDNVGVKEYRIYQAGSRKVQTTVKGTATGTKFTVIGLKSSTSYAFYVTAVDSSGNESLPSNSITVKTRR